jgi:hypothetical protein
MTKFGCMQNMFRNLSVNAIFTGLFELFMIQGMVDNLLV